MNDPKREKDDAQEVQEITERNKQSFYDNVPEAMAQQLRQAAANLSGQPAESITLEQAMQILNGPNPDPEINAELDRLAEEAADRFFDGMTDEQLKELNDAAKDGTIGKALSLTAEILARQTQEAQEVKDGKHITLQPEDQAPAKQLTADPDATPDKTITPDPEGIPTSKIDFKSIQEQSDQKEPEEITLESPLAQKEREISKMIAEHMEAMTRLVAEAFSKEATHLQFAQGYNAAASAAEIARSALQSVTALINSPAFQAVKESVRAVSDFTAKFQEEITTLAGASEELQALAPFMEMELQSMQQDPQFAEVTLKELMESDQEGDSQLFLQIVAGARKRKAEFEEAEGTIDAVEQAAKDLPRIIASPADILEYPLDKPNSYIWNLLKDPPPDGQLKLDINTGKKGGKDAFVLYTINFSALDELENVKITRKLTSFDKRVYVVVAALYNAGNKIFSATQIHKMMGNTDQSPAVNQTEKINNSLTKMGAARVYIDSTQEVKVNKGYAAFKYDAPLLPFERVSAVINNTVTDSAIHLFREPPLVTFAKERGQITTFPRSLLDSPVSKTESHLRLEDYLLERIGHMKSPKSKAPRKMLYTTIYARCGITGRKQRTRSRETILKYLEHYKSKQWIKGYKETADGITIIL